jgi:hypothetical protein
MFAAVAVRALDPSPPGRVANDRACLSVLVGKKFRDAVPRTTGEDAETRDGLRYFSPASFHAGGLLVSPRDRHEHTRMDHGASR